MNKEQPGLVGQRVKHGRWTGTGTVLAWDEDDLLVKRGDKMQRVPLAAVTLVDSLKPEPWWPDRGLPAWGTPLLAWPIWEACKMSVRECRVLRAGDVRTVLDAVRSTSGDIVRLRGYGSASHAVLTQGLKTLGLSLGMSAVAIGKAWKMRHPADQWAASSESYPLASRFILAGTYDAPLRAVETMKEARGSHCLAMEIGGKWLKCVCGSHNLTAKDREEWAWKGPDIVKRATRPPPEPVPLPKPPPRLKVHPEDCKHPAAELLTVRGGSFYACKQCGSTSC